MKISKISEHNLGIVIDTVTCNSLQELSLEILKGNWSPASYAGSRRCIADATGLRLLVLDVDDGCTLDEAKEIFKDYAHVVGTTKSHQKPKNNVVCDRFRVILKLDKPITSDAEYKATFEDARVAWPFIDKACKDISRYFVKCSEIISVKEEGLRVEVSAPRIEPATPKVRAADLEVSGAKGDLLKTTLEFLAVGAVPGERHSLRWKAALNMREQGYSEDEVIELMSNVMDLDVNALKTISDAFKKVVRHDFVEKPALRVLPEGVVGVAELLDESFEYLGNKDLVSGDSTGLAELDKLLGGGFRTGELTVLMAQAKTGKNSFYHVLLKSMLDRGIAVGYASRELSPSTEVLPNLFSIKMGCNAWTAEIDEEFKRGAREAIEEWKLFFAPGYGYFPLQDLRQWFSNLKDLGVNHFFFDHLHYALPKEDYESVSSLIKELKTLTKDLDIHINLIVQPRSLREGEKLSLAALRGGAAIGQALDNLLILERVKGEKNVSKLTLEVARHKLATPGDVHMIYDPVTTNFLVAEKAPSTNSRMDSGQDPNGVRADYDA